MPAYCWSGTGPALLWQRRGSSTIRTGGGARELEAGHACWLGAGRTASVDVPAGALLVPIALADHDATVVDRAGGAFVVPVEAEGILLREYAYSLGFLRGREPRAARILAATTGGPASLWPPMPTSADLAVVARRLAASPWDAVPLADLSAHIHASGTTLRRRFADETGFAIGRWLTRARLAHAAALLERSTLIGAVAHQVGYASAGHLARAMRREWGVTPRAVRRGELPAAGAGGGLPAVRSWRQVNGAHIAVWAPDGGVSAIVDGRESPLGKGRALWLPAGAPVEVRAAQGAHVIPLGWVEGGVPLRAPRPLGLTAWEADALLSMSVRCYCLDGEQHAAARSQLRAVLPCEPAGSRATAHDRPATHDPPATQDPPVPGIADNPAAGDAVSRLLAGLASNPADARSLRDLADEYGLDSEVLASALRIHTGMSLPTLRARVRMARARSMLARAAAVGEVSRGLGYASPSAFSRAFRAAHGVTPGQFRAIEAAERGGDCGGGPPGDAAAGPARRGPRHTGRSIKEPIP